MHVSVHGQLQVGDSYQGRLPVGMMPMDWPTVGRGLELLIGGNRSLVTLKIFSLEL